MFHTHKWEEVKRYLVPGRNVGKVDSKSTRDTELVMELIAGYTVVELRCSDCGDIGSRKLPGDAT